MGNSLRVFISYSHENIEIALEIEQALKAMDLSPMFDQNFAFGLSFHEQIKMLIAHAHVFLPIITEETSKRGWVHQEIGYAMALNIPVLPVTVGTKPGEMLHTINALKLSENREERLNEIERGLKHEVFDKLVDGYKEQNFALYESAEFTEDRAEMMARYAKEVLKLGDYGLVRQRGGLSSFHIPEIVIDDPVWKERYGDVNRGKYHCRCQRNERIALGLHAREKGCRLIVNPCITYEKYGPAARIVRLQTLLGFLENKEYDKVEIAFNTHMNVEESVTIVGDWFAAESVSSIIGQGFRQTIFTRHAPSMHYRINLFEAEFMKCLKDQEWTAESSRALAVEKLKDLIESLKEEEKAKSDRNLKGSITNRSNLCG